MNQPEVVDVVARVTQVAAYGNQIASSFNQYDATEMDLLSGFNSLSKFVNTTTTALGQLVKLLNEEAEVIQKGNGKGLFSNEGRQYVYTLATECGKAFFSVEIAILEGPKGGKKVKAKSKKSTTKTRSPAVNFAKLELQDERGFLEKIEKARFIFDSIRMDRIADKIYDINLYALLVFQVVNVGKLSKDFSSGQVDVRSIAAIHKRITRTANMINIEIPSPRLTSRYSDSDDSSHSSGSSTASSVSYSDSDSDDSLFASRNRRTSKSASKGPPRGPIRAPVTFYPCGPPPAPAAPRIPPSQVDWMGMPIPPPPAFRRPLNLISPGGAPPQELSQKSPVVDTVKPPSYCEVRENVATPSNPNAGENVISNADAKEVIGAILNAESDKGKSSLASMDSETKKDSGKDNASEPKAVKPALPNAQLFKSQSRGFGFKLRTLFRSNESLAAEMRATLESTQHCLSAFLIQGNGSRIIPHSVFHSLETTHMRTILAQIDDKEWYKTYTSLNSSESQAVQRNLYNNNGGPPGRHPGELVVLKVVKENRLTEWTVLLNKLRQQTPFVLMNDGRVVLAIIRHEIVPPPPPISFHRGPPRSMPRQASPPLPRPLTMLRPDVRLAPSALPSQPRNRISDLRSPPNGVPRPGPGPPPPPGWPHPTHAGPPAGPPLPHPHPLLNKPNAPGLVTPAADKPNSPDLAQNDEEAFLALTEYVEYTLRPCPPLEVEAPRTWDRVSITQESSPRNTVISRVLSFQRAGGNVINVKLSLTDQQSQQVTRLIEGLKNQERDFRFEWCWDEISKFDRRGEITDLRNGRSNNRNVNSDSESMSDSDSDDDMGPEIVMIHVIAKRVPKSHIKALPLYNSVMSCPLPPPPPPPPGVTIFPRVGPPPPPPPPPPPGVTYWTGGKPPKKSADPRKTKGKKKAKKYVSESESETETESDSESGSESGGSERLAKPKKTFRIKIKLNKGDDVVKALLDLWTPQTGASEGVASGKGKEKEAERKSK